VGLALQRAGAEGARAVRATVNALDAEGRPVTGAAVTVAGRRAAGCGRGCYRVTLPPAGGQVAVELRAGGRAPAHLDFALPRRWPVSGAALLRRIERRLRAARSVAYRERLESVPGRGITTDWRAIATNRLAYTIQGGSSAIIVGARRWDRAVGSARWVRSPQQPVVQPALPWSAGRRDPVLLDAAPGAARLAFYDPATPAWFDVTADAGTAEIRTLTMLASSHYMRDTYEPYGGAMGIAPPPSS
jgi:hypothetical protein